MSKISKSSDLNIVYEDLSALDLEIFAALERIEFELSVMNKELAQKLDEINKELSQVVIRSEKIESVIDRLIKRGRDASL